MSAIRYDRDHETYGGLCGCEIMDAWCDYCSMTDLCCRRCYDVLTHGLVQKAESAGRDH